MNFLRGLLVLAGLALLAAGSFWFFYTRADEVREGVQDVAKDVGEFIEGNAKLIRVPIETGPLRHKPPPRIIYLNREGAHLTAGNHDDSKKNVSAVVQVAGLPSFDMPAYTGSNTRWNDIRECVEKQFEDFDIRVVDQRPVDGDYLMVVMGGRPGKLTTVNTGKGKLLGLTPFSGEVVHDAVVLIFTEEIGHRNTRTCETVAHEIAHAFGVDHARLCSDVMTYKRSCVKLQTFRDKDTECGEYEDRACKSGLATQNSHQILLKALGPA